MPAADNETDSSSRPRRLRPRLIGIVVGAVALAAAGVWIAASDGTLGLDSTASAKADVSLLPVSFGGKCGYVDSSGKMVINPQFDNALAFNPKMGIAPVLVGGKWGLIDREGKYIVNPQFDEVDVKSDDSSIGVLLSKKIGTIDSKGNFVINPQFDYLSDFDSNGQAIVRVGQKYGIIDSSGKFIISPQFDNIFADWSQLREDPGERFDLLSNPLLIIQGGKYGFSDNAGKATIQPQFSDAGIFDSSGLAPAAIEEVDTEAFERIKNSNANAAESLIRERVSHLVLGDIRRDGLKLHFDVSNYYMLDQLRVWLTQNVKTGQWNVLSNVNRDPQGLITAASITLEQILEAPKRNKYGFIDKTGKFVVTAQFDEANNFTESGLAPVRIGTAFGYVDTKGKIAINPQWPHAGAFRQVDGTWLAVVGVTEEGTDKTRYGAIDGAGAYKINPQFDGLSQFSEAGLAVAQSGELQGAVNSSGSYVLQPVYSTLIPIRGTANFVFVKPIAGIKDMSEIGVVDSKGKVLTTVRGGICGGIYSFG